MTEKSISCPESTRLADTNLSSSKESGIPIQTFYRTSLTENEQNNTSAVPKCQFAQYSEDEPLSKYGRRHKKGRIIRKKRAFSSLQPKNVTTPALKNGSLVTDSNRLPSTKSDTETLEKTDDTTDDNNNNLTKPAVELTDPPNVRPKRLASSPKNTNYYLNEDLDTRDLLIKSTSFQESTSLVANTNQYKTSTVSKLQLAQDSEDEPFKYVRSKKGRIIHKKQAEHSLQPNSFAAPALKNTVLAMDTKPSGKSDAESLEKINGIETDSNNNNDCNNNNDNNNNNLSKPACEITILQIVPPNRQALSPKSTYVDYLNVDNRTRDLLIEAQILKHSKMKKDTKNITKEPEDEKSIQNSLLNPPTMTEQKLLPDDEPIELIELDYQDASRSAPEDPTLNNVPTSGKSAKKKSLKGNYQAYDKLFPKQLLQWGIEYRTFEY